MAIDPDFLAAFEHHKAGRLQAAEECCRRVLTAHPDHADALHLLGVIAFKNGRHAEAACLVTQAIELDGSRSAFHNSLGNILKERGNLDDAVASYRRALESAPDHPALHANLGNIFQLQGKPDEAAACYQKAIELNPADPLSHFNLGNLLRDQRELQPAAESYCRALSLKPDFAEAHNNLGTILLNQGKVEDAITCYQKARALHPHSAAVHDNLLIALQYRDGITLAELAAAHAEFDRLHAAPLQAHSQPPEIDGNAERPLVVGFVSPNFRQHAVGHFVIRALENLDRERFRVVGYSDVVGRDDWTIRFEAASSLWRETTAARDAELAEQIQADRVDILFDLAGHTGMNRLLVFARKPAPIQITWADYVGTTGMGAMDYILADRYEIPAEAEPYYAERVLRMPHGYVCYDPPSYAPLVSPLPALKQGFVTFACFNFRPKITARMLDVWANILRRLPNSRLLFKYRGIDDASVAESLGNEFARRGIEPTRIECLGWSPHRELLGEYQRVDLALDPFPYNGGLTTCEAMWMGVPVITCPGETFASRHSLSHLSNVGLTETIARDLDDYVEVAVSLASDLSRVAALRDGLRDQMGASSLCDGKQFARDFMRILREIWRQRCLSESSRH